MNKEKVILDLCGGTGCLSKPYSDAGYTVKIVTHPEFDVFSYDDYLKFKGNVYGILPMLF